MLALYGGAWLALLGVCILCLWQGRALPLLYNAGGQGPALYLGLWAVLGGMLAAVGQADRAWRLVLAGSTVGLFTLAAQVLWMHSGHPVLAAGALLAIGIACALPLPLIDARRVRKPRPARARKLERARPRRFHVHLWLGWSGWTTALLASFWCAWKGSDADLRGAGHTLLLLVCFVAWPSLCAGAWRPGAAAVGLGLAAGLGTMMVPADGRLVLSVVALGAAAAGFVPATRRSGTGAKVAC